ncbi:MAG TPA: tetratricopeptide repeat protein [Chitinophagaceae bacterium]|nr:tetratricopeptide repeat protein [Chitinophagaceae bacterium]
MRYFLLLLSAAALLFTSCRQTREEAVSKEEALALAREIDASIENKKPKNFDNLLNADMLARRIAQNKGVAESPAFLQGIKEGFARVNMGNQIIRGLGDKGTYQLVKHYEKDKVQHLVYRLYADDGLNYHDFELSKEKGKTYIADMYIYLAGQSFSSLLADMASAFIQENGKEDREMIAAAETLKRVKLKMQQGDFAGARKVFDTEIPEQAAKEKMFRLMSIQISSELNEEKYVKELTDYQQAFPDDPNSYLLLIDLHFLQKEYDKALTSINMLDKLIDKDPFLDYYRALVYNMKQQPDLAISHLESLYKQYPGFESGVLELIACYLEAKETEKANAIIEVYQNNPQFDQLLLQQVISMYGQ